MDFNQYLNKLRENYRAKLHENIGQSFQDAATMLMEDIQNPNLNDPMKPGFLPDGFMLRANQIGLALFDNGAFALAEQFYRLMSDTTSEYYQKTGAKRHQGAFYANIAGACMAQGNIDKTVVYLLKAATADVETYKVDRSQSFALTGLLQEYFVKPFGAEALRLAQSVEPTLAPVDIDTFCASLGEREYAFLAYLHIAVIHEEAIGQFPNEFSQLQILSALRNLCCLLEVELKTLAGSMQAELWATIQTLYSSKAWWKAFHKTAIQIGTLKDKSRAPRIVDDQLKDALGLSSLDSDSRFWQSLLVAYIVRNYTVHQLDANCALAILYANQATAHILNVMINADKHR